MKKLISLFVLVMIIVGTSSVIAFAGSVSDAGRPVERFEITGGMDLQKDAETTFNSTRTVSGTAEKNTKVLIFVYKIVEIGEETSYVLTDCYETVVGFSGIFTQTVKLSVGGNLVVVEAYNEDKYSKASAIVKRKKSEIKDELQQGIVLPGQIR